MSRPQIRIDVAARQAWLGKTPIRLTPTEFKILYLLAKNAGVVLEPTQIGYNVWGYVWDMRVPANVKMHVSRIRAKLGGYITTVHAAGFRIDTDDVAGIVGDDPEARQDDDWERLRRLDAGVMAAWELLSRTPSAQNDPRLMKAVHAAVRDVQRRRTAAAS